MDHGSDPVEDDELLYRRIPESTQWYDPLSRTVKSESFAPHKANDVTGLSIYRAKYVSVEEAARGRAGKSYFVAVLRARDLRQAGIDVVPRPKPGDPGHAELPDLNSGNRKAGETLQRQRVLAEQLCLSVEGPFLST